MDKNAVINIAMAYKELLKGHFEFEKMYIFGSYANGNNTEDSDIDIALIVNNYEFDFLTTIPKLWNLRSKIDYRIEPIVIDRSNDKAGFYEEILNNGIEIN